MPALSPRVIYWSKTLSKFVSLQLVVQVLGFASGILLIRTLDKQQYAYFTIANTMQGAMNVLSDSGISIGLSAIGGKVWQDRYRFSQLINTALQLRIYLTVVAIAVVTPILLWMLISNGTSVIYAVLIAAATVVGLNAQLTIGVLDIVPRLHSQFNRIQNLELIPAVSRLILLVVAYLTFLNAAVAVLTASTSLVLKRLILKHWVADSIDIAAPTHKEDKIEIVEIIKHQAPNAVFYCLQGQITIILISLFGNTRSIAEVGALGRLAVIFSLISTVMNGIVLPRFARCQSKQELRRQYWQIMGSFCLFGLFLLGVVTLFPNKILWILGEKYAHLQNELFLVSIGTIFNSIIAIVWSINATKAWIKHSWINIPATILTQVFLLMLLEVSTVRGVILFGILSNIPTFILYNIQTYRGFYLYKYEI